MVKATNGDQLVVWKLAFRPPVVALMGCQPINYPIHLAAIRNPSIFQKLVPFFLIRNHLYRTNRDLNQSVSLQ